MLGDVPGNAVRTVRTIVPVVGYWGDARLTWCSSVGDAVQRQGGAVRVTLSNRIPSACHYRIPPAENGRRRPTGPEP
jgi:hypothetical protein